jgi:hypothetical protein
VNWQKYRERIEEQMLLYEKLVEAEEKEVVVVMEKGLRSKSI